MHTPSLSMCMCSPSPRVTRCCGVMAELPVQGSAEPSSSSSDLHTNQANTSSGGLWRGQTGDTQRGSSSKRAGGETLGSCFELDQMSSVISADSPPAATVPSGLLLTKRL